MTELTKFVKTYDNMLSQDLCEFLVLCFQMSKDKHEVVKNKVINFTQMNLNHTQSTLVGNMVRATQEVIRLYKSDLYNETHHFPKNTLALEEFRIKRYNSNTGEQFKTHVDVGDLSSSKRYLAFLFYLNDNFTGGETRFFRRKYIKPKTGSVVVFPPTWQYPHAGLPVNSGTKYIMSTYLHYT